MTSLRDLVRAISIHDSRAVDNALAGDGRGLVVLDPAVRALVTLAVLIPLDAAPASIDRAVAIARAAGATDEQIGAVLLAAAPVVGSARLVAFAPRLAAALGWDIDRELEELRRG